MTVTLKSETGILLLYKLIEALSRFFFLHELRYRSRVQGVELLKRLWRLGLMTSPDCWTEERKEKKPNKSNSTY